MRYCLAVISVILLVSFMSPALAGSQSDWNDCDQTRDPDRSIFTCTRIIRGKGETARNRSGAYTDRGNAYNDKGDKDHAIADYNKAIRLDPKYAFAYYNRGIAYNANGDHDRAIADYDDAIQLDPKNARAYRNRGVGYLYNGSLAKAEADFKQASELAPIDAYAALWLDLAERRNNIPSHLAEAETQLDMKAWPAPVVRLFLGELTPTAVLAAADDSNPKKKQEQVCEAKFYSGELAPLQGSKQDAARLFRIAADGCPKVFIEWAAANAELKALDSKP
ncbi:MAG: tetratricopeptide repeat protein [Methylocella sp.]